MRELFSHPVTPSTDGWAMFNEPDDDDLVVIEPATQQLLDEIERELRLVIGSVPSAWFHSASSAA